MDLLYLHLYARLTVEQMAFALHRSQPGAVDAVARQLEACWDAVL